MPLMKNILLVAALAIAGPALADGCKTCGQVTEVRTVNIEGQGTGLGAVAGGVAGGLLGNQIGSGRGNTVATVAGAAGGAYAGHQVEKKVKSRTEYRVSVRLDSGETRQVNYTQKPAFIQGDRVRIDNGRLTRLPN